MVISRTIILLRRHGGCGFGGDPDLCLNAVILFSTLYVRKCLRTYIYFYLHMYTNPQRLLLGAFVKIPLPC